MSPMGRTNALTFLLILVVGIGIGFAIGGMVDLGRKSRNQAETGARPAPSDKARDRVRAAPICSTSRAVGRRRGSVRARSSEASGARPAGGA
jgi:hypothetical protein